MSKYPIEIWLTEQELRKIDYFDYWNNEEEEKTKPWYILNGDFNKMENYVTATGLVADLKTCVRVASNYYKRELKGVGIDLAAGNLWAAPYLFSLSEIDMLYCLEYSKHRLLEIGPKVLDYYNVPEDKVKLVLGSFYELHLERSSIDFVLLSQAFHHANKPLKLLSEIDRVLKPKGLIIIIGEHRINYLKSYSTHFVKLICSVALPHNIQKKLFKKTLQVNCFLPRPKNLVSSDLILGDHNYTLKEYRSMFSKYGFEMKQIQHRQSQFQSFVLCKKA